MDYERPEWVMTLCEAQALRDLDAIGAELGEVDVPEILLTLVYSARKDGNPRKVFENLERQGFLHHDRKNSTYRRTRKQIPARLVGASPNKIPDGGIARVARLWRENRRDLTVLDLKEPREERVARGLPLIGEG